MHLTKEFVKQLNEVVMKRSIMPFSKLLYSMPYCFVSIACEQTTVAQRVLF